MKLIDKDALLAEIDRKRNDYINSLMTEQVHVLNDVLNFLDSLEVKEVDLEKEIDDYMAKEWEGIEEDKPLYDMMKTELSDIAKHFFELGLKAQKVDIVMDE